jgi:hypothetical protein
VDDPDGQGGANMNGLDGARFQLKVGERVIPIGTIIDAVLPGLVRKGGVGQWTQREQGAHEKVCQPKAKAHLEAFPTSLLPRSQLISLEVHGDDLASNFACLWSGHGKQSLSRFAPHG